MNLELGAKIKEENESFDFNNIEDEIDLWEKYAEALAASASNGEMLLAELGKLAKEALNSDDGSFILPFPLTRVHTHLDSWVVIKAEYGRSYSFAHEKLQDYFYAWDATERRLLPAVLYHAFHTSSACPRQAHSYSKFSRATWLATAEEKSRLSISHVFLGCL